MKKLLFIIFTLLILIGCGTATLLLVSDDTKKDEVAVQDPIEEEKEIVEEVKPTVEKLSLCMVGDSLIHGSVYMAYSDGNGGYDFTSAIENLKKFSSTYDLAYFNQETILGGKEYGLSNFPEFNSPQEVGDAFVDAGFNLVSLATNHTLDWYNSKGDKLVVSSRDYWLRQYEENGVISAGSYKSKEDRDNIVIGEKNGITYALLSYTYGTNGISASEDYLVNRINKETIQKDVEIYRPQVDLLMVAMHWGDEYMYEPNGYQRDYAQFLADLDVDIVIGNHAHVIEPIEMIDDTLVIYALGNIISGQYFSVQTLTGALCSLDVVKTTDGDNVEMKLENIEAQLFYTDKNNKWKLYPYSELNEEILKGYEDYKTFFSAILRGDDSLDHSYFKANYPILYDDVASFSFSKINGYKELKVK